VRKSPHPRGKTSVVDAPQKLIVHRTKRRRTEVLCFGMSGKHMRRLQLELRHSRFSCARCTVRCRFARHDTASPWQWADALQNAVGDSTADASRSSFGDFLPLLRALVA
jgi:hypothetical protein